MQPENIQQSFQKLLLPVEKNSFRPSVVAFTGNRFLGQSSLVKTIVQEKLHEVDFIEMAPGVDGAREVVEFAKTGPVGSPVKVILVDDADRLSEPAQDALLKLSEEPPDSLIIVLICYDLGFLQPALASRIRVEFRCYPTSTNEIREYASSLLLSVNDNAVEMSCGRPELYKLIAENGSFDELRNAIILAAKREASILVKPPKLILDLENGNNQIRDAVIHVIRNSCKPFLHDPLISIPILKFCSVLSGSTSANAEIHWSRMIMSLSM